MLFFRHVKQTFCVIHNARLTRKGAITKECRYSITSVPVDNILTQHSSHWGVESNNHNCHDVTLGEDHSRIRTDRDIANNAGLNNNALAIVRLRGFRSMPKALARFSVQGNEVLEAILKPV